MGAMMAISVPQSRDSHRWVVFGMISACYFFVYFHRLSISVITPDLLTSFQTSATALGVMSSMYFYLYALEQPLVGYLSDRLGPRRVVGYWSLIATLGCVLFGLAPTIGWAAAGRGLIGFGVGGVYIPALKAFSQWFRRREFATMTGLLLASGNLGGIVATTPLAWMANTWGWRGSFLMIGGITFGLALATLILIRDHVYTAGPGGEKIPLCDESHTTFWDSILQVASTPRFWILAMLLVGIFGVFFTFQGLWATPFAMSILKLDRLHASQLNLLAPLGYMFGAPLCGLYIDRVVRKKINVIISLLVIETGIWVALTFGENILGIGGMIMVFFVMGIATGSVSTTLFALVREVTPSPILGVTMGLLNPFPLLGIAALQGWSGAIMDRTGCVDNIYPIEAYRDVFWVCLLVTTGCLILCGCSRKPLSRKDSGGLIKGGEVPEY